MPNLIVLGKFTRHRGQNLYVYQFSHLKMQPEKIHLIILLDQFIKRREQYVHILPLAYLKKHCEQMQHSYSTGRIHHTSLKECTHSIIGAFQENPEVIIQLYCTEQIYQTS